jgi:tripartite-type tricarboxylate transporter receptor subunit TctC
LAVTTAARADALPNIPSLSEFVPGYEISSWFGIGAPKNTSPEIIARLNNEINTGLADPKIKARIADMSSTPIAMTSTDFGKLIVDETEKWARVVKFSGAKAQ